MLGQRSGRIILGNPEAGNATVIRMLQQPKGGAGYCDSLDILLQWNSAPFTAGDSIPLSIQIKGAGLVIRAFLSRFEIPRPRPSSTGLRGSYSDLSGRSPSGSDSVRSRPRRSTWYPSTFIATVAEFAVSALSTYKFKFGPSALSCLLRPLLTSLSTSLRLATSVARSRHRQGSPQVSHMCFTSYPSDIRGDFPVQYWVN